jgi:predicted enzyme related to lactoylglutathione lyase
MFAIIDPENARPEYPGMPPVGSFCWHELATSDYEAAFAFYSQLFGWDAISRMDMGPAGNYLIFGQNGVQRGGMYIKPPDWPAPPNWMPYGHVANVDESATHLDAAGAKILNAPMDVPGGGRITSLIDPSGAAFAINSVMAAAKPAAKSKSKSKANPMTNPESNPELNAELNPELKVEPKPEPKPEPKLESKPVLEVKAKAKAKAKPRVVKKKAASTKTSAAKTVRKTVRKGKAVARKEGKSLARKGKSLARKGKRVARKEGRSLVRKGKSLARNFMKKAKKQVNAARSRMARRKK